MSIRHRSMSQSARVCINFSKTCSCLPITWSSLLRFKNNVAQMIIMARGCVASKDHVSSSEFKAIDHSQTLLIGSNNSLLYPAHIFVLHGGISKLHDKTFVVCEDHIASLKVNIII